MAHDDPNTVHWHEPSGDRRAGHGKFGRIKLPYDRYMEAQEIPIYRGIGVARCQDLPRTEWKRKGGKGTFVQLYGTEGKWGCYIIEVPGGGALNPEKHMFEEIYLVMEGRGTTEVWQDGQTKRHVFEWQKGSLFSIPMNANFQIVNAGSSPALLLAGNTAPNVMNLLNNYGAVFENSYQFLDRFSGAEDFYKPNDEIEPDPVRGLAMRQTNFIPDIINCDLPLDNRRSPGSTRVEPFMTGNSFYLWIGEHQSGRYSKAHAHHSCVALICLKGKGYTRNWPESDGLRPWENGKTDNCNKIEYEPFGMVSAAPGGANWFHQHFGASKEPLRLTAWYGPNAPGRTPGVPGEKLLDAGAIDVDEGGTAIPYFMEDPFIREEFEEALRKEGATTRMDPHWYEPGVRTGSAGGA